MSPFDIQKYLTEWNISFTIINVRIESIMFIATVPGERWEIEIMEDGEIQIEKFTSSGEIYGENKLKELSIFKD